MSAIRYGGQDGSIEERSGHSRLGRIAYFVFWRLFYAAILMVWRLRVDGRDNLPDGPFILCGNHRSLIDTPIIGMVTSRRMRFMGKEDMWKFKPMGAFLSLVGGFPVERGTADRTALRAAEDVLKLGEPLVMFPEGTRKEGPRLRRDDLLDGPAFLAARLDVPIVPVGIGGSARALPIGARLPGPVKVVASGPLMDDSGAKMIGSVIIFDCEDRAEIDAMMVDEPFNKAGLYATLNITRWYQRGGAPISG